MVVNGLSLLIAAPIEEMALEKRNCGGVTHGQSEAGYDIRIKQSVIFERSNLTSERFVLVGNDPLGWKKGRFTLASTVERFKMPDNLMAIVHDKSSWARRGLSVFNTVIEPGWEGYLTLELVYHGEETLMIPEGSGIAQAVFHRVTDPTKYVGRYQNQENRPVPAIRAE